MDDNDTIHVAFQAIHKFEKAHGHLPQPWNDADANSFIKLAREYNSSLEKPFDNLNDNLLKLFANVAAGQLCPMQSVIGSVAAQEIMKACSGKFHPIVQHFYFDCREALPENASEKLTTVECTVDDKNRYKAQIAVFGQEFQQRLQNLKYFLVGSGALGCEYIKNFAMMGIGCGDRGHVYITDMDTIEKSNLNRQFLFRNKDVGQPKSEVASRAAKRMNPNLNITAHLNRVGEETEHIYNDEFFNQIDGVCNALDNIAARHYTDRRCVYYRKPLIESGTLGTKGNVQIVIPYLTESYSDTQDPPEKQIPICTLKNFPNAIEHTLQWARDTFEGIFTNSPTSAIDYIKNPQEFNTRMTKLKLDESFEEYEKIYKTLVKDRPQSFEDCIKWARNHFQENYYNSIAQLLYNFPPDQLTSSGVPFWSGAKRCPHPIEFNAKDSLHIDYVVAAANIKALMYGIEQNRDKDYISGIANKIEVAPFKPKSGVVIHVNDADANNSSGNADEEQVQALIAKLPSNTKDLKQFEGLKAIEFEKDDDTNFHMDFIVACSNLRAQNYDIPAADRHKVLIQSD